VKLDRYELVERVGQGPGGEFYRARDVKLGRGVAVQVLTGISADDEAVRQRFAAEARALAALHHPNVVDVLDFGAAGGKLYLVTELVPGADLGRLLEHHGPLPEPALVALGAELCTALAHAHEHGVLHRALEPGCVLLDRGRVVLSGFAMLAELPRETVPDRSRQTGDGQAPGFASPEQLEQQPLGVKSDLFSLGVLLYFAACRHLPYEADSRAALLSQIHHGRPMPLRRRRPGLSVELAEVVQRCLEPELARRPESALVFRDGLRRVLESHGRPDPRDVLAQYGRDPSLPALPWSPIASLDDDELILEQPRRRWPWVLLAVAGVAAAVWWLSRTGHGLPFRLPRPR
jgi:serine/threonine protein kinase